MEQRVERVEVARDIPREQVVYADAPRVEERVYTQQPQVNRMQVAQPVVKKSICSKGLIACCIVFACLMMILALLYGLGVFGGAIPIGSTTPTVAATNPTVAAATSKVAVTAPGTK